MDRIEWPAPPDYEYPPSVDSYGPEPCVLTLGEGKETRGNLLAYAATGKNVLFQGAGSERAVTIALGSLRAVLLERPTSMQRRDRVYASPGEVAFADHEKAQFSLAFVEGTLLAGETIGWLKTDDGVFLYHPCGADTVLRRFVAAEAIKSLEIQEPQPASPQQAVRMRNEKLAEVYRDNPEKYPYKLEERFARIVNRIAELWQTPQLDHYFDDLLMDQRGDRQGFPADVMSELMAVHAFHTRLVAANAADPSDPWGFEAMRKELKEMGIECTPKNLLRAVESGDAALLDKLIRAGMNVNHVGEGGWTPLMVAAFNGREMAALVLIQAGATVNARDKGGYSPLHWAAMNGYVKVAAVLIKKDAVVNARNDFGWTPLLHAAGRGHDGVVRVLLEAGAVANLADKEGWTPLHKAAVNGHLKAVEALLDAGADQNLKHKDGATPLMLATEKGHRAIRTALIAQAGIDNANRVGSGNTPT